MVSNDIILIGAVTLIFFLAFSRRIKSLFMRLAPANSDVEDSLRETMQEFNGEWWADTESIGQSELIREDGEKYLLSHCSQEKLDEVNRTRQPVKLGYFYKKDWSLGYPFYLFICSFCKQISVDCKHGDRLFTCINCERGNKITV